MCIINNDFLYFGRKLSDLHFIFASDMKLQELLRKCDFDKMFEYIVKFDPKSEGSRFAYLALRWFKEAQSKGNRTVKSYIWYLEKKLN